MKKPLHIKDEKGLKLIGHSTPLIFAFRQELAPDAIMAGCCGFTGPFPPPLSISRFYVVENTKVPAACQSNMQLSGLGKTLSNYVEKGICIWYNKPHEIRERQACSRRKL